MARVIGRKKESDITDTVVRSLPDGVTMVNLKGLSEAVKEK